MKRPLLVITILLINFYAYTQDKPAYVIYDSSGQQLDYGKMLEALQAKNIILFGELHNNPIAHWLQYELATDLNEAGNLILGAEMFEADNQDELNAYLKREIDAKALDTLARLWKNYKTDYAPLVDIAKNSELAFVATNIPRRYANLVYRKGFEALDSLTKEERSWMAPLPILFDPELPGYKNILSMMGDHGTPELVKAQAIKDATMAYFIMENYKDDHVFLHFNGAYHSKDHEGILWYLKKSASNLEYATINTVEQEDPDTLEAKHRGSADFIIAVDKDMTKTY